MNRESTINFIIIGIPIAIAILLVIIYYDEITHTRLKAMLAGYKLIKELPGNITFIDFDNRKYMGIYNNFHECKKDLDQHLLLDVSDPPLNWYCNVVVYIGHGKFIQCYVLNNKYIMFN